MHPALVVIFDAAAASIFIALPLSDVIVLSAEPKVKLPVPLGSIEIAPLVPVVIVIPAAPSKVNAPALVVILDAAAASNEIPALASTVIAAPLMSTAPVVVTSISEVFPTMFTPPSPFKVNAPVVVVKLEAAPASNEISFDESISVSVLSISTSPLRSVAPVTSKVFDNVVAPVTS